MLRSAILASILASTLAFFMIACSGGGTVNNNTNTNTGADAGSGSDAGSVCTTDTWASYGQNFFSTNCASCHTNNYPPNLTTQAEVQSSASTNASDINSGKMPPGSTLSDTEKARIVTYLNCGAP